MFISDHYKMVFLEVPRTGSRSITMALTQMDPDSPTAKIRNETGALIYYHSCHIPDHVDDSYIIVASHRNPYERIWSHWKFRRQYGNPDIFKSISWQRYVSWACNPDSVPEITNALIEMPINEMMDCDRVTHWLNFEGLETSWQQLIEDTALPLPDLDWINRSPVMDQYPQAYDSDLANMIAERFAGDFTRFNYDVDSWRSSTQPYQGRTAQSPTTFPYPSGHNGTSNPASPITNKIMHGSRLETLSRPRQHPSVVRQVNDRGVVLKVPERKEITTLNSSAYAVWELCDGQRPITNIADMLAYRSGLSVVEIYPEVEECINDLLNSGLLILDNTGNEQDHHPDTNIDEGHLGGYIRGRQSATPTVEKLKHGDPATWTPELWLWAYQTLGIRSVIDIGCGEGHAARYFRDLGCDVLGIDGSKQAKRDSVIPGQHVTHDFTVGPFHPATTFDLAWSCEFVEHVEERYLDNFLETFTFSRHYLMMTYAGPGQPGHHHVNCQHMDYWIDKVESAGFQFDQALTETSRAISSEGHYKHHGLLFTRS